MVKIFGSIILMLLLSACVSPTSEVSVQKTNLSDPKQAIVLLTVGEGWAFNSGQAYTVLSGSKGTHTLQTMTDRRGGSGSADVVEGRTRAFEYNAVSVTPGNYAITKWGFRTRAGKATIRQSGVATLEAGKVYYLGSFFANNLTQTSRITDKWTAERSAYLSKYPKFADQDIHNVAKLFRMDCWKMDVTDGIVAKLPILADTTKGCR